MDTPVDERLARLSEPRLRLFGRLGAGLGAEVELTAAVALTGAGEAETRADLQALADAGVLEVWYRLPGRYRDLAVDFHRRLDTPDERREVKIRLIRWWVQRVCDAQRVLQPHLRLLSRGMQHPPADQLTVEEATAIVKGGLTTILTCQASAEELGLWPEVCAIAEVLAGHLICIDHPGAVGVYERGLAAAEELDDRSCQVLILTEVARAYLTRHNVRIGRVLAETALRIAVQDGDRLAEAAALEVLGSIALVLQDTPHARRLFERARAIYAKQNIPAGVEAMTRNLRQVDRFDDSPDDERGKLELMGDTIHAAVLCHQTDDLAGAQELALAALRLAEELTARTEQRLALTILADVAARRGEPELAHQRREELRRLESDSAPAAPRPWPAS